ncbi:MAG: hypothetical protein K9J17_03005 [Flavobacteriales bacterium]|nr:hypothetical protein [Flavobacteriales bacterium]
MTSIRIRPRFKATYNLTPTEIEELVRKHLAEMDCGCSAEIIPGFIVLRIRMQDRHFWSPQLSLSFEKDEEGNGTIIRGHYGPNPMVWAFFTYGYAAIGILSVFLGMYGFSQYSLKQDAGILWVLPVFAAAAAILYIIAQFGQKLGVEQTFWLHHFFEESIGHRIHLS